MARKAAAAPTPAPKPRTPKPRARRAAHSEFDIPAPPAPPAEEPLYIATAPPPPPRRPSLFGRHPLLAGVAIACVMGAGAGLWARPVDTERKGVRPAAVKSTPAPEKPAGELTVFVGEAPPAPLGEPMEVMRAGAPAYYTPAPLAAQPLDGAPPLEIAPAPAAPEPAIRAPVPRPDGLTRIAAVEPEPAPAAPTARAVEKKADKKAAKTPEKAVSKAEARKPEAKKTLAKTQAKTLDRSKAKTGKPEPKLTKAKAKAAEKAPAPKLTKVKAAAKNDVAREIELLKAEVARLKKPKPDKSLRLAEARAKAIPAKAKAAPKSNLDFGKLLASLKTKEPAKVEKAVLKAAPPAPAAPKPEPKAEPPKAAVVTRAVERDPCASGDPGETLVCQNPTLQSAERAMNRAYRAAEDAGVEPWRLRQQQRRWLAARAAAARENPWAVRDVYEARIAELDDLRRSARGGY